jgi:hypothetical protein
MMNWKGLERKRVWPNFKVLPDIRVEGLRKIIDTSVRIADLYADT